MTEIINNQNATFGAQRTIRAPQLVVQLDVAGTQNLSEEVIFGLKQVKRLALATRATVAVQIARCNEIAEDPLHLVDPPHSDLLQNPELMEEFKRKQKREARLVDDTLHALFKSDRAQTDLLRGLSLALPQLRPAGPQADIALPGFKPSMEDPSAMDTSGLIWNSHNDFYAQISALLGLLKTEWLSKYQESLGKFLDFYKEFSDIMEKLKFEAYDDKGAVKVDFREVKQALDALARKYGMDSEALASFPSKEQAEAFVASLGLGSSLVVTQSGGTFHVKIDMTSVNSIKDSMTVPANGQQFWMDAAHYNSWLSAKDSNVEQIKHVSKVLGEKLSEMTQKYDNVVKILSSTIEKITEADKSFLQF